MRKCNDNNNNNNVYYYYFSLLLFIYKLSKRPCLSYWTTVVFKLPNRLTCSPILEWTSYCTEDWQQPICKRIQRKRPFLCQAETERNWWVYFSWVSSLNHQTSPSLHEAVLRSSVCFLNLKLIPLLPSSSRVKNACSFSSTSHFVFKQCCTFTFTFSWYCHVLRHQCLCARLCLDVRGRFLVLSTFSLTNQTSVIRGFEQFWKYTHSIMVPVPLFNYLKNFKLKEDMHWVQKMCFAYLC